MSISTHVKTGLIPVVVQVKCVSESTIGVSPNKGTFCQLDLISNHFS